ncbi:MAG: DUF4179 domain-containing protein, partial [Gorillibacterium sp.]|nr:DUF4179 domain-containing protein [Gorillibacterium sp.]
SVIIKSMSAAAVLLLAFVTTMNVSPAFAETVMNRLPLLSALVIVSDQDKGLDMAIKNDYVYQNFTQATDNGITFTVQDIIADEKKITFSYKLTIQEGHDNFTNLSARRILVKFNGKEEQVQSSYQRDNPQFAESKTIEGTATLNWDLDKESMPDKIVIYADEIDDYAFFFKKGPQVITEAEKEMVEYKQHGRAPFTVTGNWSVELDLSAMKTLSTRIFKDITFKTETATTVTLKSVEIAPTLVKIIMDGGAEMNDLIRLSDKIQVMAHLEDGNGVFYQASSFGGIRGSDYTVFYFESSYFSKSKDLYFVLDENYGSLDHKSTRVKLPRQY